jgi:hypothetical protein
VVGGFVGLVARLALAPRAARRLRARGRAAAAAAAASASKPPPRAPAGGGATGGCAGDYFAAAPPAPWSPRGGVTAHVVAAPPPPPPPPPPRQSVPVQGEVFARAPALLYQPLSVAQLRGGFPPEQPWLVDAAAAAATAAPAPVTAGRVPPPAALRGSSDAGRAPHGSGELVGVSFGALRRSGSADPGGPGYDTCYGVGHGAARR